MGGRGEGLAGEVRVGERGGGVGWEMKICGKVRIFIQTHDRGKGGEEKT